jgi:hypothetical protein
VIREKKGKEGELTNGAHATEYEGKEDGPRGVDGPLGSWAGLAVRQKKKIAAPLTYLTICNRKRVGFEIGFDIWFEFDPTFKFQLHSFELQINQRKSNSLFIPYFKYIFYRWAKVVENLERG